MSGDTGLEKRVILSLSKLTSLLYKHSYVLTSAYCVGSDVHFVEVRTPKLQKTFVIHVPPKYQMKCDDESYKRFQIASAPVEMVSSRQQEYLMEIKGPLIDCDLLSISSTVLCLYKNNGQTIYYKIGDAMGEELDNIAIIDEPELESIDQIVKDTAEITKILEPENVEVLADQTEEQFLTEEDLKHMTLVPDDHEDAQIELEFEDVVGEPIDETANLMIENPKTETSEEVFPKKKSLKELKPSKEPENPKRRDNSLPPSLEDADVSLGIVYYSIDIGGFYKRAATLEDDILSIYNTLDDNEDDLRGTKVTKIALLTEKIIQKIKTDVEANKKKEGEFKTHLLTLSSILEKTDAFQMRINKDKKKFKDIKPDIDRIQTQTKTTIYDINVELLRVRDTINDLLDSVQTSLEEILNI